jgi:hypothetical protein
MLKQGELASAFFEFETTSVLFRFFVDLVSLLGRWVILFAALDAIMGICKVLEAGFSLDTELVTFELGSCIESSSTTSLGIGAGSRTPSLTGSS